MCAKPGQAEAGSRSRLKVAMLIADPQIHAHVLKWRQGCGCLYPYDTQLLMRTRSQVTLTSPSSPQEHNALPSGLHCTHTTAPTWADTYKGKATEGAVGRGDGTGARKGYYYTTIIPDYSCTTVVVSEIVMHKTRPVHNTVESSWKTNGLISTSFRIGSTSLNCYR